MSGAPTHPAWHRLDVRLWSAFAVLLVGVVLGLVTLADVVLSRSLQARDRAAVRSEVGEIAADYATGGLAAIQLEIEEAAHLPTGTAHYVRFSDTDGRTLAVSTDTMWRAYGLDRLAGQPLPPDDAWLRIEGRGEQPPLDLLAFALGDGHVVQVAIPSEREETVEQFRILFLLVGLPVLLLALGLGGWLARRALRPLRRLTASVEHVAVTGALDARVVPVGTGDELDALVTQYNHALDRIAALVTAMRGSLDAVAHDLRTPLARLRTAAELSLGRPGADAQDALGVVLEEAEALGTLLDALLDAGEAEAGTLRLHRKAVALDALLPDAADLFAFVAEARGVSLLVEPVPPITVEADPGRLRQALAHLLDNAVKFTPAGGHVTLTASTDGTEALIAVADTGPGIAPTDLPRIWDRLYRGDPSRSERGMGLGLSLARAIVEAHGGTATVASEPGAGSVFTLRLPRTNSSKPTSVDSALPFSNLSKL